MKFKALILTLIALALTILLGACYKKVPEELLEKSHATATARAIARADIVTLQCDRQRYHVGETGMMRITIHNSQEAAVDGIDLTFSQDTYAGILFDYSALPGQLKRSGLHLQLENVALPAGASKTFTIPFKAIRAGDYSDYHPVLLSPGSLVQPAPSFLILQVEP